MGRQRAAGSACYAAPRDGADGARWCRQAYSRRHRPRAIGGRDGPKRSEDAAAQESLRAGSARIAKITKDNPFVASHLTNNVEYIEYLEAGGSDRHPQGMVAVTVQDIVARFGGPVEG